MVIDEERSVVGEMREERWAVRRVIVSADHVHIV